MKLKVGDEVYLQIYDFFYIADNFCSTVPLHYSIRAGDYAPYLEWQDCFDFRGMGMLLPPGSTEWIMKQDWLIDYDKYAEMSIYELQTLHKRLSKEFDARRDDYESGRVKYSRRDFAILRDFGHEIASLKYLIDFRKGKNKFRFPAGYCGKTTPDAVSPFTKMISSLFR